MADGDVKDLESLISSIDENSKSTTDNIGQILGILQNLDKGSISSNKKNNKKAGADNASGVTSMLKAVNNVTPKLHTFSTNISDINRGLKSLSNTISKFNQGIKDSYSTNSFANQRSAKNSNGDSSSFTDIRDILKELKDEIVGFRKDFSDKKFSDSDSNKERLSPEEIDSKKRLKDIQRKIKEGQGLNKADKTFLRQHEEEEKRWEKFQKRGSVKGNVLNTIGGGAQSFISGNIDASSAINSIIGMVGGPWGAALRILKGGADLIDKEQGFGRDYARTYGGGKYGRNQFMRQSANFRFSQPISSGYTAEEYYNGAVNISNNTGREIYRQSNANIKSAIDLKRMGIEGEELGMFDTFGRSMQSTDEYFNKLYGRAGSKGLSFKKMTDAIKSNLKMAQTYTFTKGVDSLQKMAETSTRLKYNMSEVARFAEKVNTVEGAIKTSANLSVLGGDFAQFSNPMGLLYESLNDMEGLNDRMVEMFSKMARWDDNKKQIDISSYDKNRIRIASEAMGVDANEMMNIAMNRQRERMVESQASKYGISGNTLDYVKNLAQINKNGQAFIANDKGDEVLLGTEEFKRMIPELKKESEAKNNKENAGIGDVYAQTRSIYDFLNDNLKGVSGYLGAVAAKLVGGKGSMSASQKAYFRSIKDDEEKLDELKSKYGSLKNIRRAIKRGDFVEDISEKFGGDEKRQFIDKNFNKHRNDLFLEGIGRRRKLNFANEVADKKGNYSEEFEEFLKELNEEKKENRTSHVGLAGNDNEHFARILRGESVLTRRGTDILGKGNVRILNSGQNPFVNIARNVALSGYDYLKTLSVAPSQYRAARQAGGQQKIAFEPITLTINGQFNVNSAGQFRNIPLDDIDTRALKKAILDTVTENIPSIMRKANILNNRGYDMENDRYRGAIQGSYI